MTEFKVGDKVRVRVKGNTFAPDVEAGSVHVIDQVIDHPTDYPFAIRDKGEIFRFHADEIELITPQKEETVVFDSSTRDKYTGKTVFVSRNYDSANDPEELVFIGRKWGTRDVFTFDVREVPKVIKALQSVCDDYQQMLEVAKPKVEDVLNGLGVGAVVETDAGFMYVKMPDGTWRGPRVSGHVASDFGDSMDGIEILSEGVHLD